MVAVLLLLKPCLSYYSEFGMSPGQKALCISNASLQKLKELAKYEYFFRVYHNNEIYRTQTEIVLGPGWVKVKKPSTQG